MKFKINCLHLNTDLSVILCLHPSGENGNRAATKNDSKRKEKHLVGGVTATWLQCLKGTLELV